MRCRAILAIFVFIISPVVGLTQYNLQVTEPFTDWHTDASNKKYSFHLHPMAVDPAGRQLSVDETFRDRFSEEVRDFDRSYSRLPVLEASIWSKFKDITITEGGILEVEFSESMPQFEQVIRQYNDQLPHFWRLIVESTDNVLAPYIGQEIAARAEVDAWERYPSGAFGGRGRTVATLPEGTNYVVDDVVVVPDGFFGDKYFLKVHTSDETSKIQCDGCWVFQGRENVKRVNFVPAN